MHTFFHKQLYFELNEFIFCRLKHITDTVYRRPRGYIQSVQDKQHKALTLVTGRNY